MPEWADSGKRLERLSELTAHRSPLTADLAASYQHAICRHLVDRLDRAMMFHLDVKEIHLVGGVSANTHLRNLTENFCATKNVIVRVPKTLHFCTDNAAMIAAAASFLWQERGEAACSRFDTAASIPLESVIVSGASVR